MRVLLPTLGIGVAGAIPMLFVAIAQIRRACGERLFGSREHFCSTRDLGIRLLSLPLWIQMSLPVATIASFLLIRRAALKIAA